MVKLIVYTKEGQMLFVICRSREEANSKLEVYRSEYQIDHFEMVDVE